MIGAYGAVQGLRRLGALSAPRAAGFARLKRARTSTGGVEEWKYYTDLRTMMREAAARRAFERGDDAFAAKTSLYALPRTGEARGGALDGCFAPEVSPAWPSCLRVSFPCRACRCPAPAGDRQPARRRRYRLRGQCRLLRSTAPPEWMAF